MSRLLRPYDTAFRGALWLLAATGVGVAAAIMYFGIAPRSLEALGPDLGAELSALPVAAVEMWKVERSWAPPPVTDPIESPVIAGPCVAAAQRSALSTQLVPAMNDSNSIDRLAAIHGRYPDDLVAAVALGAALEKNGRFTAAERIAGRTIPLHVQAIRDLIADRKGQRHLGYVDPFRTKLLIHLYYIQGLALLSKQRSGADVYAPLRNAIGLAEDLDIHRELGSVAKEGTSTITPISIPGCDATEGDLTTGDLYNNLIVAYETRGYTATDPRQRSTELARDYTDTPQENPTLALLQKMVKNAGTSPSAAGEGKIWAVSNAERILRAASDGRPEHPLLALNITRLIEDVEPSVRDAGGDEALHTLHDGLIGIAVTGAPAVAAAKRERFANQLAIALPGSRDDESKKAAATVAAMTKGTPATVLSRLAFAAGERSSLCRFFFKEMTTEESVKLGSALGSESSPWLRAARVDAAVSAARWGKKLGPRETELLYLRLRQMTRGWKTPPEVEELGKSIPSSKRMRLIVQASRTYWIFVGLVAGLLIWLVCSWLIIETRRALAFHTSFYHVESEYVTRNEIHRPSGVPGP